MPEPLHPPLPRARHGGPDGQAAQLDFSVNANPYGPNPLLLRALRSADHAEYPDPSYLALRSALADWHGVGAEQVVPAVGASELLHRVVRAYVEPGDRVLSVLAPFGEFGRAAALARAELAVVTLPDAADAVQPGVKLVYLGHPHNPSGRRLTSAALATLAHACQQADALLVLDLAYAPFLPGCPAFADLPAALHLYSPGKAHGLVGARPAYALAPAGVAAALHNLAPAWVLPAGTAALLEALPRAQAYLAATLPLVARHAADLAHALSEVGTVEHHGAPYLLLEVGNAARVAGELLSQGLRVRDCASYGLPEQLRLSARLPPDNARLVAVLRQTLNHG
ncbi:aminotransferase class I/II-fold pyridoxal phosphate-dependent enzyme [Deinococcus sp. KNUC1210]|uniref:aminotransferase class I/II-fold pyridoxal phosphate-dependent enzyme n=1 Tax=Deinococcus sp. KNUC1210 TaxID=2917691 RepID=UPI001EF10CBA|nr:aminotransferase class I/II-fold pyridoxal phosphate-dependent enzyme [Deinococcus sp. KNUC1210]ULH15701.1 aminotransferase class I/II-fold pyridoxal phosphate-dependent enzyme [Deinococcus sp. KNUC1210]